MIPAQNCKTVIMPPVANVAATTNEMSFDRTGFDYCVIDILVGATSTQTSALNSIIVSESDTLTTPALMEDIPALSGSTTTSTAYGFAIPAASATSAGLLHTIQFDLKPRKKYIGLSLLGSAAGGTANIGVIAHLYRGGVTPISAAERDGVNLYDTAASGCVTIVTG